MRAATQPGMTPPVPGQEKEEPDLWQEDDIPTDDSDRSGKGSASDERPPPSDRAPRDE